MKALTTVLSLTFALTGAHAAGESLEARTARECKKIAVDHALTVEREKSGGIVRLLHLDRSISLGSTIGDAGNEVDATANVEVTLERESRDPIVYEMVVEGTTEKRGLNCRIIKTVTRELLQEYP